MIYVSLEDRYGPRTFSFAREAIVIGSDDGAADLVLDIEGVAKEHVRVIAQRDALRLEDARGQIPPRTLEPEVDIKIAGLHLHIACDELGPEDVTDDTERTLLDAIRDNPSDTATREVYADWLEGTGQPARAEFLRVQLAQAALTDAKDARFQAATARLAELAPAIGVGWRARVATTAIERCSGVRFELVCPMRWDKLEPTSHEAVRACHACKQHVTYCTSIEQARTIAQSGGCIAVDIALPRDRWDLQRPPMLGRPSPEFSRYGKRS